MAPPITVASEQKATTRVPSTAPTAASMPESSSAVISSRVPSSSRAVSRCTGLRGSSTRGSFAGLAGASVVVTPSHASEGHGDVGAAEAEGVVERRDVAAAQLAGGGGDVELDLWVEVVEVDRGRREPVVDR